MDCYDSIYCYQKPDCPLFETCQEIIRQQLDEPEGLETLED